jgi:triphosphatase
MSRPGSNIEIELKAAVPPRRLSGLSHTLHHRCGRPGKAERLRTVYFDTKDRSLAQAGIAVRMRHGAGGWRLSIKADRETRGGVQRAREAEVAARGPRPDLRRIPDHALRDRVQALLGNDALEPLFETRISRTTWAVTSAHGVAEVALDRGRIRAGTRDAPVSEVEIELVAGDPNEVFLLAEALLGDSPADVSVPSKADRGLALATGESADASVPPLPGADPDGPAEPGFSALLEALATQISRRLYETLTSDAPEGPHQLRVALRRLRAALWLHRPLLDRSVASRLAATARDVGRLVSPLRDADVLVGELLLPSVSVDDPALGQALSDWHRRVRTQVRKDLRRARATAFVIQLNRLVALGGWERAGKRAVRARTGSSGSVVRPRLDRLWGMQREAGERLASLDSEGRHAFRKQMKKLRYAVEFAVPVDDRKPFLQACKRLQESLGELNDQAVLQSFAPSLPEPELAARLQGRLGDLRGGQRVSDLALGRACRHWQALSALNPPWRDENAEPPQRQAARHR